MCLTDGDNVTDGEMSGEWCGEIGEKFFELCDKMGAIEGTSSVSSKRYVGKGRNWCEERVIKGNMCLWKITSLKMWICLVSRSKNLYVFFP